MDRREELVAMAESICAAEGVELYWLEYKKARGEWRVSVFIDGPGGVTIDDCARVSRALGSEFDVYIDHRYTLEVSSPGIERVLHKEEHFKQAIGELVQIKTYRSIGGKRTIVGQLQDVAPDLTLKSEGGLIRIPLTDVARARVKASLFSD